MSTCSFSELGVGDGFVYNNTTYMKIATHDLAFNSINLGDINKKEKSYSLSTTLYGYEIIQKIKITFVKE